MDTVWGPESEDRWILINPRMDVFSPINSTEWEKLGCYGQN